MSIASRLRWRRRRALLSPAFAVTRTVQPGLPVQRHLVLVWLGFGVQLTVSRAPHWLVRS